MKELNYEKIGERLRKLRLYMGLTQEQVASILNVGRDAILRIEKGSRKITVEELIDFSKLYCISLEELISCPFEENMNEEVIYARGLFDKLTDKDKKEIIRMLEYKNLIKKDGKEF